MSLKIEIADRGAELISIKFNNKEMLHDEEKFWDRKAPILFPTVGRLRDNKTIIEDKEYRIPQHGFAKDMEFELVAENENAKVYMAKSNQETLKMYPYNFELYVAYIINKNTLTVKYKVVNKDKKQMLFGIGGHPGFKLDMKQEEYYFELNRKETNPEFMEVEGEYISDKLAKNILKENRIINITKESFKNDAIMMKKLKSDKIALKQKRDGKKILELEFEDFPILAIWSIPEAPFVCLEPWYNYADRVTETGNFKDKEGVQILQPNQEFDCKFSVTFF